MNPIPAIPMLGGEGSGKVVLVIGILVAAAYFANCNSKQITKA